MYEKNRSVIDRFQGQKRPRWAHSTLKTSENVIKYHQVVAAISPQFLFE